MSPRPRARRSTTRVDDQPQARASDAELSAHGGGARKAGADENGATRQTASSEGRPPASSVENGGPVNGAPVKGMLASSGESDAVTALARMRSKYRVTVDEGVVRTNAEALPEVPRESGGLLELVPSVARRALELGLSAREPSFHVFVASDPEVRIEDDIFGHASRFASTRPTPRDIVYVHDFDHPEAPRPLLLPAGQGPRLVGVMGALIDQLKAEIPAVVEGDEFKHKQTELAAELEAKNRAVIHDLETVAKTLGFGVRPVHGGVQTFPMLHGKPVSAEQFDVLDDFTKRALSESEDKLTREVDKAAAHVRAQSAGIEAAREAVFSRAAASVIERATADVEKSCADLGLDVKAFVDRVREALIADWEDLVDQEAEPDDADKTSSEERDDPELATRLNRFKVNLLVSHVPGGPAPVLYDTNPTYPSLFGYLERRARYGALLTDFTRIRAGSLHRSSGGVLIVRAGDLLADPIIWERVKRVLREQRIGAEDPLGPLGLYATTLRPVPVPIDLRVVLVGSPELYAQLLDADPDFASLFRIKVEVEPVAPRTPRTIESLDAYLMTLAKRRRWGHFDRAARATLIDLATRLAADREKLALTLSPLEETMAFASALATARASGELGATEGAPPLALDAPGDGPPRPFRASIEPPPVTVVGADDVQAAWLERRERAGSAERHIREITLRGEVALETSGLRVGVVNGLSVFSAGDVEFGQPMRITAVVGIGREGIIDVEREAQLGGSIHTKGVAILRGYLTRMFGQERPLSLRAQLAFEQSYGEIDGDSASSSELFAVLSALADIGIDQGIAVTGSVNQLGEMQAIGGLCAKIEGFFDLCKARGLNGEQGVLLPVANRPHLVLRDDVAEAVAAGHFHLYAIERAAQGIEILTGVPAGERDARGRFLASSIFGRVERRIIEIAERLREAERHGSHDGAERLEETSTQERIESHSARRR